MNLDVSKSILEQFRFPITENEIFSFDCKRDDLIDPVISGNKWRKLEYNLLKAVELHKTGILTFGGAFSNHLVATAKAAHLAGFQSIGVVRGEELNEKSNATLSACSAFGMKLLFVSRMEYRAKEDEHFLQALQSEYPSFYIVPEGGRNYQGMIGCQHILLETKNDYDHIYLAGGTGATAAGVLLSVPEKTKVHVVSALRGDFLYDAIKKLLYQAVFDNELVEEFLTRLTVVEDIRFGGYGRISDELLDFINHVYSKIKLKLDPIYTGKACYQMISDFEKGNILSTEKTLFIHTGGLQGATTWKEKINYLISFDLD